MTVVAAKSVVSIQYTLKNGEGETIDASEAGDPLRYLHGAGNIVPGLEKELEGKNIGDKLEVVVQPADGYGEVSGPGPQSLPREAFEGVEPAAGMSFVAEDEDGKQVHLWVLDADEERVVVTPDHPLAGVTLHFAVEIEEIREATAEELEHGHVH
ncbi:MAG: peptidylprolyl isomerase [Nannocystaceae bacterium]|nr:peptidylprolyl isomerase [Nannocystaceae bacterium]